MTALDPSLRQVLAELRRAASYAAEMGRDPWDFAVELQGLLTLGASFSDLRWMVCRGYIRHAVETTLPGDATRGFRDVGDLLLPAGCCFVITEAGITLLDSLTHTEAVDSLRVPSGTFAAATHNGQVLVPTWDRYRQELRVGGVVVKQFKVPAPNQELILAAFQEEGWPVHIDDPLPPRAEQDTKRRLHETITSLNRHQRVRLVRFMGDGTGQGVRWELIPTSKSSLDVCPVVS
jgi:hypothetical protein